MAWLSKDVKVNEEALQKAAEDMRALKVSTEELYEKLSTLYDGMEQALQTDAGKEMKLSAKDVILEPVTNLSLVINQMSETLDLINSNGYYKDIFSAFEELRKNL